MIISDIQLYELLASKLGRQEAQGLVEFVEGRVEKKFDDKSNLFLTKQDKVDIIKWMFVFWIGAIGVLSGILVMLLNAYLK